MLHPDKTNQFLQAGGNGEVETVFRKRMPFVYDNIPAEGG
jgi:hypothetical protein